MTMLNGNIFRQAKELLHTKRVWEMTAEEVLTVKAAQIPLDILPEFSDKTTDEGLEELAWLFEEAHIERASEATQPSATAKVKAG